jgi:molybdate transport system regulatory protein
MTHHSLQYSQALGHEASDKRLDILRRIGESGSISEAARSANVSYKAAWQALETLSNLAGAPLVEKAVGGSGGGGARLTPAGTQLLEAAVLLEQARTGVLLKLDQRDGNALNVSGLVGLGLRTSMRNQLQCTIQELVHTSNTTRVRLELPHGATLISKITRESAELLGLAAGMSALALCKATAVAVGSEPPPPDTVNQLHGEILGTAACAPGDELALRLAPNVQFVGFNSGPQTIQPHRQVIATVNESAVVIAIAG